VVLGSMPTEHVVRMLAATPPDRAVTVLLSMPKDRIDRLLAAMDARRIAELLLAADPGRRRTLLGCLDDSRLAAELALLPMAEAAAVVAALPIDRAVAQLDRVASEHLALLLDAMPGPQRRGLADALDPLRQADLRRVGFEKSVIEALRRTSATLAWVPDDHGSNLFAGVFHRLFGISLCYVDRGVLPSAAVRSAQGVFGREQVHGLLVVTNAVPAQEAEALTADPRRAGAPSVVLTWNPDQNDGALGRALIRLAG
jgi:hypothetical protein